jgi:hypothetical protein
MALAPVSLKHRPSDPRLNTVLDDYYRAINNAIEALNNLGVVGGGAVPWGNITGKPSSYPPSDHSAHSDLVVLGPWVDVRAYTSFAAAITAIGASNKTLMIPTATSISGDITVPANVKLWFKKSGSLAIATGVTVTINGPIDASLFQIFTCTGTGKVTLGAGSVEKCYPEWWGAKGDAATDDAAALAAAITAAGASGTVFLSPYKVYNYATGLSITAKTNIVGAGKSASVLNFTPTSGDALTINVVHGSTTASSVRLEDFSLTGPGSGSGNGIKMVSGYQTYAKNVFVKSFGNDGWNFASAGGTSNLDETILENCNSHSNGRHGFFISPVGTDSNLIKIIGGSAYLNDGDGYHLDALWTYLCGPDGSYNTGHGVCFDEAQACWGEIYAENNTDNDVAFESSSKANHIMTYPGQDTVDAGQWNSYYNFPSGNPYGWNNFRIQSMELANNELYFKNKQDSYLALILMPGSTSEGTGNLAFANKAGTWKWVLAKSAGESFYLTDPNSKFRELHDVPASGNSATHICATGSGAVRFNDIASNNSGIGGAEFYSGGASPSLVAAIDASGNTDVAGAYKVDGTQVVGNRVIDERCDDTVNSGDATTDGVIDALRDAMIAHGLIAAS